MHLHSSEHEKFDKHTPESFAQLAAELKDVAQNRPGELADHEQASGLKYDPYAVPWDDEVRAKLAPRLNHFPDWMHTFPGSGGLAQYNVNAFVLQLSDYDISAEDIDLWCRDVHLPLSMTRLSKTFFRDRIVQRAGAHMRAFASEVLTAVVLLVFFVDCVVRPVADEALQPSLDCFDLLRLILAIFCRGISAEIPALRNAMKAYHQLYLSLGYHRIAKLHLGIHCIDFWEFWEVLLSCFGPERHHKLMKRVMNFAYRHSAKTALAYDVRLWIQNLQLPILFKPIHLAGKITACSFDMPWPGCSQPISVIAFGASMTTERGHLTKGSLLQYTRDGGGVGVGFALAFIQTAAPHIFEYGVVVWPYASAGDYWVPQPGEYLVVKADAVVGGTCYRKEGAEALAVLLHPS